MPASDGLRWRKSTRSAGDDACVEVAPLPDGSWLLRDSKADPTGSVLRFTSAEWRAFLAGVRDGEFD